MTIFLQNLSRVLRMIWLLFPAILFIFVSGLTFSSLSQGQDVLLMAVERRQAALLLLIAVTFFAFVVWYTSRLLVYVKATVNNENYKFWSLAMPRILGYLTFSATQAGIIYHPYFQLNNDGWWLTLMLAIQGILYYVVYLYFKKHNDYKRFSTLLVSIVFIALALAIFLFSARGAIYSNFLVQLIGLWLAQTTFLIWTFIRAQKVKQESLVIRWEEAKVMGLKVAMLPATEIPFFNLFNKVIILPALIYLAAIFSNPLARLIGPFNIALLSFSILVAFFQLLTMVTVWKKINIHFLLFVLAIVVGFFISPYRLRRTEVKEPVYNNRLSLEEYTIQWLKARENAIAQADSFPMYFVLSDGGASRSGYWVAGALGMLETETQHKFSNHLFCLSGASGGSVGNAVYYSLLDTSLKNEGIRNGDLSLPARNYLKSDFLSSTLSHMLGPDYFRHIVPLGLTVDRGGALELSMENSEFCDTVGQLFGKHYSEYIKSLNPKQLPVFYINTTRVSDGSPGVVSNIKLNSSFTPRIDVLQMMDTAGPEHSPFGDINLSSAAVLSARFPYLSPAANIDDEYFVDGGYFDNSGAGIVLETVSALLGMFSDTANFPIPQSITSKIQFRIIHLSNSQGLPTEPSRMHPMVNDLATPLLTLAGSYGQQTNVNNDRLRRFIEFYANNTCPECWTRINLYDRDTAIDKDDNAFSMNWVISDTTLRRMDFRLSYNPDLKRTIKEINALKE